MPLTPEDCAAAAPPPQDRPLLSEHPDRERFTGLSIINRRTGEVEHSIAFSDEAVEMPGYVESVERGYEGSKWRTERTWQTD